MTVLGEVKFKVRRSILMLKEFAVNQLLVATGVSESSARTEIHRMVNEGLLVTMPTEGKRPSTGGRPPVVYKIAPGAEAKIYSSIEPFYAAARDTTAPPTSRYYKAAREALDHLVQVGPVMDDSERAETIGKALKELDAAEFEEDLGAEETSIARMLIDRERAKAKALTGDIEAALQLKAVIQKTLQSMGMSERDVGLEEIDECICAKEISPRVAQANRESAALSFEQAANIMQEILDVAQNLSPSSIFAAVTIDLAAILHSTLLAVSWFKKSLDASLEKGVADRMEQRSRQLVALEYPQEPEFVREPSVEVQSSRELLEFYERLAKEYHDSRSSSISIES